MANVARTDEGVRSTGTFDGNVRNGFPGVCNFKEERETSPTKTVESKRDELVQSARLLGESLSRRAFGERGPDWNVWLVDLEQFLRPLVQAMVGGFVIISADEQTQRLGQMLPCPTRGRVCERQSLPVLVGATLS